MVRVGACPERPQLYATCDSTRGLHQGDGGSPQQTRWHRHDREFNLGPQRSQGPAEQRRKLWTVSNKCGMDCW